VVAGPRLAYVPGFLLFINEKGKRLILHPTKGWRSA
jgi:hypothetical protein